MARNKLLGIITISGIVLLIAFSGCVGKVGVNSTQTNGSYNIGVNHSESNTTTHWQDSRMNRTNGSAYLNETQSSATNENSSGDKENIVRVGNTTLVYSAGCSGLNFTSVNQAKIIAGDERFKFVHTIGYYCCANMKLYMNITNRTITILEKNDGKICRCQCVYNIYGKVYNLAPGEYTVKLMGVEYVDKQVHFRPKLIIEKDITVPGRYVVECHTDSDCVHIPSCCHQGAQGCVPKEEVREHPICKGVPCTMNCMPCTQCKCVNGTCQAIPTDGCC